VRLPENIGGAGGFHEGAKIAYREGYDLIWLSDDDAYPEPDAIEKLAGALRGFEEKTGRWAPFACSMIRWTDGSLCEMNTPGTVWDWPRFYSAETPWFLVKSCSFVSALVPRWAVEAHGLPIRDYFIWYDDAEYTQRLAKAHPGLFVPDSVVIHDIPDNKGVNYGLITDKSLWKFRYGARNETSFRRREQGWWGVAEFVRHAGGQMIRARIPGRLKLAVARAIWSGLFFRPRIEKPTE
jgi:GT2 family glycosyltransferase